MRSAAKGVVASSKYKLWHADQGMVPHLWEYSPSQIIFQNLDVTTLSSWLLFHM